jgi:hypothetical protein
MKYPKLDKKVEETVNLAIKSAAKVKKQKKSSGSLAYGYSIARGPVTTARIARPRQSLNSTPNPDFEGPSIRVTDVSLENSTVTVSAATGISSAIRGDTYARSSSDIWTEQVAISEADQESIARFHGRIVTLPNGHRVPLPQEARMDTVVVNDFGQDTYQINYVDTFGNLVNRVVTTVPTFLNND